MTLETDLMALIQPLAGGTVIWMDQNAPRPALPYCAMKIMSVRQKNRDHYSDVDDSGIQTVAGDREFTLNIQRYQAYGVDGVTGKLQAIADKLRLISVIDKFKSKGLVAFNAAQVQDISALLDKTQIEKRASLDIFIRYRSVQTDDVGLIETANIQGQDDGVNSPVYTVVASV